MKSTSAIKLGFRYEMGSKKVMESKKEVLRKMMVIVKEDCRSTTRKNLHTIQLRVGKSNVNELSHHYIKGLVYHNIPTNEEWKVNFAKDLLNPNRSPKTTTQRRSLTSLT